MTNDNLDFKIIVEKSICFIDNNLDQFPQWNLVKFSSLWAESRRNWCEFAS